MPAELIVVNGPLAGTRFALDSSEVLVGRDPNAKLVLPDTDVGWRHCTVRLQGGRYLVTDLRSSAGTYVNGMRSAERWLEDKDQIGIGKIIVMFRSGETTAEPALPPSPTPDACVSIPCAGSRH
jgi:pSer/pThr/pTyr-binding forkhead associated (FHA) protein